MIEYDMLVKAIAYVKKHSEWSDKFVLLLLILTLGNFGGGKE